MNLSIFLSVAVIIYTFIISIIFKNKQKKDTPENRMFSRILMTTLISSGIEIILNILVYLILKEQFLSYGIESVLNIILRLFNVSIFSFVAFFNVYTFIISKHESNLEYKIKYKKQYTLYKVVCVLAGLFIFLLPNKMNYEFYASYSYGSGVNAMVILSGILVTSMVILILPKYKELMKSKVYLPILSFMFLMLITIIINRISPQFILVNLTFGIIVMLLYHTIENPDLKLIAELNIAKDSAEKSNRAKSDFLASMSHEIRTPLNAIVGLSTLATENEEVPESLKEDLNDILNASQTLLEIVGNVLDINQIETNNLVINETEYSIIDEVNKIIKLNEPRIGDKNIKISLEIADDVPKELLGDKKHIKQILNNLLSNAVKYTEAGFIKVSVRCISLNNKINLILTVQDTGKGIKAENINKLFKKFERLDTELNSTVEGTGLGLAITKSLVELLGGKINVQSNFGSGSIFMVQLPQKKATTNHFTSNIEAFQKYHEPNQINVYPNKKILIVDDNIMNLKVTKKLLSEFNFEIDECVNGKECVDLIKNGNKYDLILMDIMMPVMSGEETLKELKKLDNFNIPVIALTADAVVNAESLYLSQGFVDYIAKPVSKTKLIEKVKVTLKI